LAFLVPYKTGGIVNNIEPRLRELGEGEEFAAPGKFRAIIIIDSIKYQIEHDVDSLGEAWQLINKFAKPDHFVQIYDSNKVIAAVLTAPEEKKFLFEILEVGDVIVSGWVRESPNNQYGIFIPRSMCPKIPLVPGGSFYIKTIAVDPIEEYLELEKVFKDV
jgi:hypothetical protein